MTRALTLIVVCCAFSLSLAEADEKQIVYLDLQPCANQKLTDDLGRGVEGNDLANVPEGDQTLEGVKFKIADGFIQLGSNLLQQPKPEKVEGIKVGEKFSNLHLLHATGFGNG